MIRISLKGLAKLIEATPSGQRKILQDFKYPNEDEARGMRLYYQDALKKIVQCHKAKSGASVMRSAAAKFMENAAAAGSPQAARRWKHNARAVSQYADAFGDRLFEVLPTPRLSLSRSGVTISAVPDLLFREKGKLRLAKFEFSERAPTEQTIRTITQCLYEAAAQAMPELTASGTVLLDIPRGHEHRGARAGARTLREIEATCLNVVQLWPGIDPPKRTSRRP